MKSLIILKDNSGFTLIEVTMVIAIISFLFATSSFVDLSILHENLIGTEQSSLVSILQKARDESMSNLDANLHGVHIDTTDYILFSGQNYVSNDIHNETIAKNDRIFVSGPNDIVFAQLSGEPNKTGKIILDDGTRKKIINIKTSGLIDW